MKESEAKGKIPTQKSIRPEKDKIKFDRKEKNPFCECSLKYTLSPFIHLPPTKQIFNKPTCIDTPEICQRPVTTIVCLTKTPVDA